MIVAIFPLPEKFKVRKLAPLPLTYNLEPASTKSEVLPALDRVNVLDAAAGVKVMVELLVMINALIVTVGTFEITLVPPFWNRIESPTTGTPFGSQLVATDQEPSPDIFHIRVVCDFDWIIPFAQRRITNTNLVNENRRVKEVDITISLIVKMIM